MLSHVWMCLFLDICVDSESLWLGFSEAQKIHMKQSSTIIHLLNRSWGSPMELRRHHFFFPVYLKFYQGSMIRIPWYQCFSFKSNSRELLCGILTQGTLHLKKWGVSKLPLSYPWSANHRIVGLHWRRRGRGRTVDDSRSWFVAWGNVENWRCFAD